MVSSRKIFLCNMKRKERLSTKLFLNGEVNKIEGRSYKNGCRNFTGINGGAL